MDAQLPAAIARAEAARPSSADVWSGLAAMLVAMPSALAFGVAIYAAAGESMSGAGAFSGMVGAIALGIVAPLASRNVGFVTTPCAPAAAVLVGLAAALGKQGITSPSSILALLALAALIAAMLQVVFGWLRLGRLIKYLPFQVVTGYSCGVAVIIASGQLPRLLGVSGSHKLHTVLTTPSMWMWQAIVVGCVAMATMITARRFFARVPGAIVALACGVLAYFVLAAFDPDLLTTARNPLVVGPIDASGSLLDATTMRVGGLLAMSGRDVVLVLASGVTLAVLLSIDTLKTGLMLDGMLLKRHDSNRELMAQGIANLASFATGGIPGSAATAPTLVNVTSGARTYWAGVIAGGFAFVALVALAGLIAWLPVAALAGILLVLAYRSFDFTIFRLALHRDTRLDFAIIVTVIATAQAAGLIEAALVGVALAILLFIRDQAGSSVILRKRDLTTMRSKRRRPDAENRMLERHGAGGLVLELKDNLFFGTTDQLLTELDAELQQRSWLLIDLRRVALMDYSAAHLFDQMRHRLASREGALLFCGLPSSRKSRQDIRRYLDQVGLMRNSGVVVFETRDAALEWMESRILAAAGWIEQDATRPLDVRELPQFDGFGIETIDRIDAAMERREFRLGDSLFRRGDAGDELLFVRSGLVHIELPLEGGKHHHLATFGRGELFGELSFLDRLPRSADAIAATGVSVFVLSRARFDAMERKEPHVAGKLFERIARVIAHRLRTVDAELRELEER